MDQLFWKRCKKHHLTNLAEQWGASATPKGKFMLLRWCNSKSYKQNEKASRRYSYEHFDEIREEYKRHQRCLELINLLGAYDIVLQCSTSDGEEVPLYDIVDEDVVIEAFTDSGVDRIYDIDDNEMIMSIDAMQEDFQNAVQCQALLYPHFFEDVEDILC